MSNYKKYYSAPFFLTTIMFIKAFKIEKYSRNNLNRGSEASIVKTF